MSRESTPKKATQALWGHLSSGAKDWIERGWGAMSITQFDLESAKSLVSWIEHGVVDPTHVADMLAAQNWDYQEYDDYGDNNTDGEGETYPLSDVWSATVGCATALSKGQFILSPHNARWLQDSLCLFELPEQEENGETCTSQVDESHEAWLKQLCKDNAWAQEPVALWVLDDATSPAWGWAFNVRAWPAPSVDFIDRILQAFDTQEDYGQSQDMAVRAERMALFMHEAPSLYASLIQAHGVYGVLYGKTPQKYSSGHGDYCQERALTVQSMHMTSYNENEGAAVSSRSAPTGMLFAADPSMAV